MSICRYCGQKTGWFKDAHDECVQKARLGLEALKTCVGDAVVQGKKYDEIKDRIGGLVADSSIPNDQVLPAIKDAWGQGAKSRSIAQPISDAEVSAMSDFYRAAGLTQEEMRKTAGFSAMVFSFLIWTALHNQIEPYQGPVRFNLQHGEVSVFGIANVLLTEERTTSSYVGAYSGASIRVANGLYYHLAGYAVTRLNLRLCKKLITEIF